MKKLKGRENFPNFLLRRTPSIDMKKYVIRNHLETWKIFVFVKQNFDASKDFDKPNIQFISYVEFIMAMFPSQYTIEIRIKTLLHNINSSSPLFY